MTAPLVSFRNLGVELGGHQILRGVNANLLRGQITALIGLNGSGKTTLLRAVLREIAFTGSINFHCGHDHTHPAPEHIGYVPQKLQIDARLPLTVCDLMALALQRRPLFLGVSRRRRAQIIELLAEARTEEPARLLDRPVEKLSGGEMQRVLLALALKPRPELLLLDEPAQGIDFQSQQPFYDLITERNRTTGVTVLMVSHDISMVSALAHHVLCLKDGRVACEGPPGDVEPLLADIFGHDKAVYKHTHAHNTAAQP